MDRLDRLVQLHGQPLRRAHCGTLGDNENFWAATGGIELEDFRYDALKVAIKLDDDKALNRRIELLRKALDGYRPGPYDQLAATLRASGNEEHASTVSLKKQQFRYDALAKGFRFFGPGVKFWSWLQRSMVGYGYRPVRALGWLLTLLVPIAAVSVGVTPGPLVVPTEKPAVVWPAATTTLAGRVTRVGSLLCRVTG